MPIYSYRGFSVEGKEVKGIVEASSRSAAILVLKEKGVYPTEIKEERKRERTVLFSFSPLPPSEELVVFFRTLATMLDSGIPIVEAISSFAEEADNKKVKLFFSKVRESLKEGKSFEEALREGGLKDKVVLSLILSGERSGLLSENLKIAASIIERREELKSSLVTAFIYPAVLLLVAFGVVVFMMVTVIPKVVNIYTSAKLELPISTKLILFISNLLTQYYILLVLLCIFAVFLSLLLYRRFREKADFFKFKLPVIGKLLLYIELQRFFETLSNLVSAGVPLVDSLEIASLTVRNVYLQNRLGSIVEKVKQGFAFYRSFREELPYTSSIIYHLLKAGEETGKLADLLMKASLYLKSEFEYKLKNLTSLLEPVTMLVVGVMIGFIIYALLLPIVSISTMKIL